MASQADVVYKSRDDIIADVLSALISRLPDAHTDPDSIFRIWTEVFANSAEGLYLGMQLLHDDMFIQTMSALALTRAGEMYGRPQKAGLLSTGTVRVSGAGGTYIPIGTVVSAPRAGSDDTLDFATTSDGTIPNPGVPGAPVAADGGSAGVLTGTFEWGVTFLTNAGETEIGPPSNALTLAARRASISAIPRGGASTVARRLYRRPAGGAWGLVVTINDNNTQLFNDNLASLGVQQPPEDSTAEQITLNAQALDVGKDYNVQPGTIVELSDAPAGVAAVTNDSTFAGGFDPEDIENFRIALLQFVRAPQSGSAADLKVWAESVDGVESASVFPGVNLANVPAAGSVTVRISGPSGSIPGATVVANVLAELLAHDLANITILVGSFTQHNIPVGVGVTLETGFTLADVTADVQQAVADYIAGVPVGGTVFASGIIDSVFGLAGVTNVTTSFADTPLSATEKAVAGAITVSAGAAPPSPTPGTRAIIPAAILASSTVSGNVGKTGAGGTVRTIGPGHVSATSTVTGAVQKVSTVPAAHVQSQILAPAGGVAQSTSYQLTMPSTIVSGHYMVVAVFRWAMTADESLSLADNLGNVYTRYGTPALDLTGGDNIQIDLFTAPVSSGGTATITATLGVARAVGMIAHEVSGGGIDKLSTHTDAVSGTGADAVTSGAQTPTQNNELICGFVCNAHSTVAFAAGTGYTQRQSSSWAQSGTWIGSEDKVQGTAASVAATWNETTYGNQDYVAGMVTIKPGTGITGGGGGGGSGSTVKGGVATFRWGGSYDVAQISNYARLDMVGTDLTNTRAPSDLPNVRNSFYRSACSCRPDFDTSIPWSQANSNGWLLRDSSGNLLYSSSFTINNILDISNPAVSTALANNCVSWCNQYGYKVVFLDDVVRWGATLCNTLPAGWDETTWLNNIVAHINRMGVIIKAAGLEFVLNASGYIPGDSPNSNNGVNEASFWNLLAPYVTGLCAEYWVQSPVDPTQVYTTFQGFPGFWDGWRALHSLCQQNGITFQPIQYGAADDNACRYGRASFLLDFDRGKSVIHSGTDSANPYGPVWCKDMGAALGPATSSGGVWTRQFANGTVTVNPGAGTSSIT